MSKLVYHKEGAGFHGLVTVLWCFFLLAVEPWPWLLKLEELIWELFLPMQLATVGYLRISGTHYKSDKFCKTGLREVVYMYELSELTDGFSLAWSPRGQIRLKVQFHVFNSTSWIFSSTHSNNIFSKSSKFDLPN